MNDVGIGPNNIQNCATGRLEGLVQRLDDTLAAA